MCTIAILVGVADLPLVVAANRDELYARDARPPQQLAAGVAGGVDAQSGGTWLAVNAAGRFVAVTNQRALAQPVAGVRSRGLVVRELASTTDPDAYVDELDPGMYASMNLVWGDAERVRVAYLRHDGDKQVITLARGVHVLCNDRIGAGGFPRGERLHDALDAALVRDHTFAALAPAIATALGDHTRVPIDAVPSSHLPPEIERELTATCIHTPTYGTRSSTIVALAPRRVAAYLHADGPPCVTPFTDRMELVS